MVGGDRAHILPFGYQISIQVNNLHICGGGIVSVNQILTAAHCFIDSSGDFMDSVYTVVAGVTDAKATGRDVIRLQVEEIFVPAEFDPYNPNPAAAYRATGDIAVLKVT